MTLRQNGVDVAEDVGIIVPPPDVKEILETTAEFVGKNPALEARVLQQHDNDPRFFFLNPTDPYHAYYRSKVEEKRKEATGAEKRKETEERPKEETYGEGAQKHGKTRTETVESGGQKDVEGPTGKDDGTTTTKGKAVVSFLKSVQAKEEAARPEPREPPPDDLFSIINVNPAPHALGLDVMKLTAEFVARHGADFLAAIGSKESRNALFDFLKPLHPHFIVFQRLVDAYKMILDPSEQKEKLLQKLLEQAESEQAILDEVWYLHDWECQRAEREHEAAMDESEKLKAAQIDWHDFVVLETVNIDEEEADLPAPVADANQLPKILAAAKKAELEREKNRGNVDMDVDQGPEPAPQAVVEAAGKDGIVVTVNVDSDIPADRIRKQPVPVGPSTSSRGTREAEEATVVLPSGQRVPLSKAEASMRAELLDPSYKGEQARAEEKNRLQNLAGGEEMARSLALWQKRRTESGVYNRGDLQTALSDLPRPPVEVADLAIRKAEQSGPRLPGQEKVDEVLSPPAKKARVEAAVGALSNGAPSAKDTRAEEAGGTAETERDEDKLPGMVGAKEWTERQGGTAVVRVRMPVHGNREWKLEGQEMEMSAKLKSTVGKLKAVLAKLTKLPVNKQKLLLEGFGFMKDKLSLAHYNVKDGAVIALEVKERGGRRKHG